MSDSPRIYVASLSDYNAGRLVGAWIDCDQDGDDIHAEMLAMLATSKEPWAEEWAIHDYEGFEGIRIHESESFETCAELAEAIEEHGAAFAAFYDYQDQADTVAECVVSFEEAFSGEWRSEAEFAEELAGDIGMIDSGDQNTLLNYVDWERFARDLFMGDYYSVDGGTGVYVFRSC